MKLFNLFEDPRFSAIDFDAEESNTQEAEFKKNILKQIHAVYFMIKKQCQPWLKQRTSQPVYRGFRTASPGKMAFIRKVRHDRNPKDSDLKLHQMFDFFIDELGLTANRTNSMFTSGSLPVASSYGPPYVLFPVGNFNYTWSEYMNDWYSQNSNFLDFISYSGTQRESILKDQYAKKNPDIIKVLITLKKNGVERRLSSYKDDMSWGSSEHIKRNKIRYEEEKKKPLHLYINELAWNTNSYELMMEYPALRPYVMKPIKDANKQLRIHGDDNSLEDAIKSNKELMIHCDSIICVHPSIYPIIQKFLQGMTFQQVYAELDISNLGNFTSQ